MHTHICTSLVIELACGNCHQMQSVKTKGLVACFILASVSSFEFAVTLNALKNEMNETENQLM